MAAMLLALRADRFFTPQEYTIRNISWYSFLMEAESTPGRLEWLGKF
jgi:hypothetical protein